MNQTLNVDQGVVFTINGMKVGWRMIPKEDLNHYAVESGDLWH